MRQVKFPPEFSNVRIPESETDLETIGKSYTKVSLELSVEIENLRVS